MAQSEINELCDEWNNWLKHQANIDDKTIDAQEALFYDLSKYQRRYVTHFSLRWETAQDDEFERWQQQEELLLEAEEVEKNNRTQKALEELLKTTR